MTKLSQGNDMQIFVLSKEKLRWAYTYVCLCEEQTFLCVCEETYLGLCEEQTYLGLCEEQTYLGLCEEQTYLDLCEEQTYLGFNLFNIRLHPANRLPNTFKQQEKMQIEHQSSAVLALWPTMAVYAEKRPAGTNNHCSDMSQSQCRFGLHVYNAGTVHTFTCVQCWHCPYLYMCTMLALSIPLHVYNAGSVHTFTCVQCWHCPYLYMCTMLALSIPLHGGQSWFASFRLKKIFNNKKMDK